MSLDDLRSDQLKKIDILKEQGIDPYPSEVFRTHEVEDFLNVFESLLRSQEKVVLCGRVMSIRSQGGLIFLDIFDGTARTQALFKKDTVNNKSFELFLETVSPSDFIEVAGVAFVTKRGTSSLLMESWRMLSKSLRQVPDIWSGLKDEDEKYRKRYLDILLNPSVADLIKKRSVFWNSIRSFMLKRGFVEVETPILETSPVGARAHQFIAHHNALDMDVYLRISPELWHKKLLIGGIPKVFEIGRVFRNENMSHEHAQDYTAFEFYESYKGAKEGVPMFIELFRHVAKETFGTLQFTIHGFEVDLEKDWKILDFNQLIVDHYGFHPRKTNLNEIKQILDKVKIPYEPDIDVRRGIDIVWKQIQKTLGGPSVVTKIPYFFAPLGKRSEEDSEVMDEFKIMIGGSEVGHGFNELNDPIDQRDRFAAQQGVGTNTDDESLTDYEHVEALEYGMPPTFGLGLSERLFSFLADVSIREAQIFPLMKPTKK